MRADRLAAELGLGELWIKNDTVNPTGSFKDRVVSVALAKARELGFKVASCASTGNLANSVAAHAARAGMHSVVFIPSDLEPAKVVMTAVFGGQVVAVDGSYDDVNRLCAELAGDYQDWAFVNINIRAYYAEGSKTLAYEVAEQLGWRAPDHVVVPVGSGSQLCKIAKGFARVGESGADPGGRWSRRRRPGAGIGRAGRRLLDRRNRVRLRRRPRPARQALDHRQVASPSATRPTGSTPWTWSASRGGRCLGQRRRDRRCHRAPGPHRGHLRRDRRRASPSRCWPNWRRRASSGPTSRSSPT